MDEGMHPLIEECMCSRMGTCGMVVFIICPFFFLSLHTVLIGTNFIILPQAMFGSYLSLSTFLKK